VVCWGSDHLGQATAPSDSFTAISAGPQHACGLRTDGMIDCWGKNTRGQVIAPSGSFSQISSGNGQWCALRRDGSVACWGSNAVPTSDGTASDPTTAPPGSFTQVSAGSFYGCGLRTGGTIVCWGENGSGQATPPSGSFAQVSGGFDHACGVRTDGSVVCWGDTFTYFPATAPTGSFTHIFAGHGGTACVPWTDGSIRCWDNEPATGPSGSFTQVSGDSQHGCGLRTDGTIDCWGRNQFGVPGSFTAVSAGPGYTCGLETGGRIMRCIGDPEDLPPANERFPAGFDDTSGFDTCAVRTDGSIFCRERAPATAPPGSFTQVSAGFDHTCGVRTDGSVACWGGGPYSRETLEKLERDPPSGPFGQISAGNSSQCGLRTDGSIVCWGEDAQGLENPPSGSFSAVSVGGGHSCGLRTDGTIDCWGDNRWGQADAPPGSFTAVSASGADSCGVRTDGSVECWGGSPVVLPAGPDRGVGSSPGENAGVHQPAIDALRRAVPGIFDGTGCDQGLCPREPLKRWEMAVWLVRVLDRTNPATRASNRFADVDAGQWWAPYADQLAELGVTAGCALKPLRFCPDRTVSRAEMAAFLVRAFNLAAAPAYGFVDTAGNTLQAQIDALAAAGVTAGCALDPPRYCPGKPVTRAEMATFLARALGLI